MSVTLNQANQVLKALAAAHTAASDHQKIQLASFLAPFLSYNQLLQLGCHLSRRAFTNARKHAQEKGIGAVPSKPSLPPSKQPLSSTQVEILKEFLLSHSTPAANRTVVVEKKAVPVMNLDATIAELHRSWLTTHPQLMKSNSTFRKWVKKLKIFHSPRQQGTDLCPICIYGQQQQQQLISLQSSSSSTNKLIIKKRRVCDGSILLQCSSSSSTNMELSSSSSCSSSSSSNSSYNPTDEQREREREREWMGQHIKREREDERGELTNEETQQVEEFERIEACQRVKRAASLRQHLDVSGDNFNSSSFLHFYSNPTDFHNTIPLTTTPPKHKRVKIEPIEEKEQTQRSTSDPTTDSSSSSSPSPPLSPVTRPVAACVSPRSQVYFLECPVTFKVEEKEIKIAPRLRQVSKTKSNTRTQQTGHTRAKLQSAYLSSSTKKKPRSTQNTNCSYSSSNSIGVGVSQGRRRVESSLHTLLLNLPAAV